ncbi:MAG: LTA synthase family protein, partial [Candidatus Omnitrophica bacterium]|nr:LTA synthase family protein [Candidatus Omnitrophota bacterium]
HEFLDYLESKGFYIATESRSNHALTFLSLASSLNMEYLNRFQDELGIESTERRILYEAIKNNKVMAFFKTRGYKFVHFSSGWDATNRNSSADLEFNHGYLDEFMTVFIQTTILEPFVRHLIERDSRKRILDTFASLSGSHKIKGKKFVFAHVLCPHPPFIFGANGEFVPETKLEMSGDVWAQKENYLNQLLFINKLVKGFIEEVLSMSQNPPIIILQADHGPWVSYGKMDETMSIFNAYYLPPGGEKLLYKTISPVNSFRLIFNFYFGLNYRLLEDRNYYSDCETPYSFIDVTDGLIRDHRGI